MNNENAKDYLPLVQALAEGKAIESKINGNWIEIQNPLFSDPASLYRIKPSKKFIRVAQVKIGSSKLSVLIVESDIEELTVKAMPIFVKWLTDRIEYESE